VSDLLQLHPGDLGHRITEIARAPSAGDLAADAEAVMRSLTPVESQVQSGDSWYVRRVLPYRTQDDRIAGVVVTWSDVTELRRAVDDLADANRNLESRIEERTRLYRLIRDVSALANRTDVVADVVRGTLNALCEQGGWSLAHVYSYDTATATLLPSDIWAPETGEASEAFRAAAAAARFVSGDSLIASVFETGRVRELRDLERGIDPTRSGLRDTGLRRALLLPITAGGSTFGVLELFSVDAEPSPEPLITAMGLVATELGQAMLRQQTEALAAQLETKEQQRIARDLHDGLGQRVSAVGMMAHRLRRILEERGSEEAATAAELSANIEEAKMELRSLVRGLMPVYPGSEGLVDALDRLVDEQSRASRIRCSFDAEVSTGIEDGFVTRHLYFIAQEALRNALRHAKPTHVAIRLHEAEGRMELSIRDDGVGISEANAAGEGSGLRIMRHRAALLAARLVVDSSPGGGTTVRCRLRVGAGFARASARRSGG
jgi:signal transduction histidine kinase